MPSISHNPATGHQAQMPPSSQGSGYRPLGSHAIKFTRI